MYAIRWAEDNRKHYLKKICSGCIEWGMIKNAKLFRTEKEALDFILSYGNWYRNSVSIDYFNPLNCVNKREKK